MVGKRTPKRVGFHDLYTTGNDHEEWSVVVQPGGLQIDSFHKRGKMAHIHAPEAYDDPIDLPGITRERAQEVVRAHLVRNKGIKLEDLLEELMTK